MRCYRCNSEVLKSRRNGNLNTDAVGMKQTNLSDWLLSKHWNCVLTSIYYRAIYAPSFLYQGSFSIAVGRLKNKKFQYWRHLNTPYKEIKFTNVMELYSGRVVCDLTRWWLNSPWVVQLHSGSELEANTTSLEYTSSLKAFSAISYTFKSPFAPFI